MNGNNTHTNDRLSEKEHKDNLASMIAKSEAQASTAISAFLNQLNVQKIVYVDDRCSINELREAYIGKMKYHYADKPRELDFINWELAEQVFENEVITLWDGKSDEERRELYLKILKFENVTEELENSIAPLKLKSVLKDKIDLFSPSDWLVNRENIIQGLSGNSKILFLFDIEFKYAPLPDGRDGRHLAAELLQDVAISDFLYCGIFSHLFSIGEEYEKRSEYCQTHQLEKEKFYTISKKRFQNDSYLPGLAEGIRNTLLINEVELLKSEISDLLGRSFNASIVEINNLTPESFNHIIQKSSFGEGVWEMATLIRISNIITTNKALNSLVSSPLKRTKINQSLGRIRQVEKIKTGGQTPYDKTQIFDLREKELYTSSEVQNQLHYPLSNGDIFNIEGKDYILLVQPCNVAMRQDGCRGRKDSPYNIGFLAEIEVLTEEKFKTYTKNQLATIHVLEDVMVLPAAMKIVRFSTFQSVSLSPLDLTVFNVDGKARIDLAVKQNLSTTIQDSWKKRYVELYKEFSEFAEGVKIYNRTRAKNKKTLQRLALNSSVFSGYKINNEKCFSRRGELLEFNIRRVRHYKSPYSDDVLQKFMLYLSRNAFDHDFTN